MGELSSDSASAVGMIKERAMPVPVSKAIGLQRRLVILGGLVIKGRRGND